jgi:tetratricopeptide (TPR) repeat protein
MPDANDLDYSKICFVIMPFGKKPVAGREVDFDFIYTNVFKPAIEQVDLPEGGKLQPRRTDQDFFSADIDQEMFQYIEYSRFTVADISGLNANVFYELGVRHHAHESGTAIFRQESGPPPFDIGHIKAFPYEYQPEAKITESIALIKQVLMESLVRNRLDSPPMKALRAQREAEKNPKLADIEPLLVEADNAIRHDDWLGAVNKLGMASAASPNNIMVHMKRGLIYRDHGRFREATRDFQAVIIKSPKYAEAYRERGIAENKIFMDELKKRQWPLTEDHVHKLETENIPSGETSLRKSIELAPDDFDAWSSLGGILKRQGRMREAAEAYGKATEISQGNTYPLLNAITIASNDRGQLVIEPRQKLMLGRARRSLKAQVENKYNRPWSSFDLAQACLFTNDPQGAEQYFKDGLEVCSHKWQPRTFRETLELLTQKGVILAGLAEVVAQLKKTEELLPD